MYPKIILSVLMVFAVVSVSYATQYEYDSLNRLSKVTYDNHVQIIYTYDNSGNRTARVISMHPDIVTDGAVDNTDLAELASLWLFDCQHSDWCNGTDLDLNGKVELKDFASLASYWLAEL